jgi:hypothetical protein
MASHLSAGIDRWDKRGHGNGPPNIPGGARGGLITKIYALVDALGNPFSLMLAPGQNHDMIWLVNRHSKLLIHALPTTPIR